MARQAILGVAAACAAFVGLAATTASADPKWGGPYGGGYYVGGDYDRGGYGRGGYGYDYSVDRLMQREDRLAQQIRYLSRDGRFNRWEAANAWRGLNEARAQTSREAREHGRILPAGDYYRIAERLDRVDAFVRHEARDFD